MERLPSLERAIVDRRKITEYLLADHHPAGRTKAEFFKRYGFRQTDWRQLEGALRAHATSADVAILVETEFGTKYIFGGVLMSPDGRNPRLRAVWLVPRGEVAPRFVTAYPE